MGLTEEQRAIEEGLRERDCALNEKRIRAKELYCEVYSRAHGSDTKEWLERMYAQMGENFTMKFLLSNYHFLGFVNERDTILEEMDKQGLIEEMLLEEDF